MELNPRNSLYSKSFCTLKNTSLPHLLKIFHGIIISVEICICLLSSFSHSKLIESCKLQGDYERSNNMKSQTFGRETTHLRFCQSSGHGSSPSRRLDPYVLLGWRRNGRACIFLFFSEVLVSKTSLTSHPFTSLPCSKPSSSLIWITVIPPIWHSCFHSCCSSMYPQIAILLKSKSCYVLGFINGFPSHSIYKPKL